MTAKLCSCKCNDPAITMKTNASSDGLIVSGVAELPNENRTSISFLPGLLLLQVGRERWRGARTGPSRLERDALQTHFRRLDATTPPSSLSFSSYSSPSPNQQRHRPSPLPRNTNCVVRFQRSTWAQAGCTFSAMRHVRIANTFLT